MPQKSLEEYIQIVEKEYNNSQVQYADVLGVKLPIPVSYKGNEEAFLDDVLSFQDNRHKVYDLYNLVNKNKQVHPKEIKYKGLHVIASLDQTLRNLPDREILSKAANKATRRYTSAIKKVLRARAEHPKKDFAISMNKDYLSKLDKLHYLNNLKETSKTIGKGLKFTAEQTAQILGGALGALPAVVYNLSNKKYHFAENRVHMAIKDKALPYIRKGAVKALIVASSIGGATLVSQVSKNIKENQQRMEISNNEKQEMQEFLAKHKTNNEAFYYNYKKAQNLEAEILCCIATFENFRDTAYICEAGEETIGYGTRYYPNGRKVRLGDRITKEDAYKYAAHHLRKYVYPVFKHIDKELSPSEVVATCMFVYNMDETEVKDSHYFKVLSSNASEYKKSVAISKYRSVKGKRSYGLIGRRGYEGFIIQSENVPFFLTLNRSIVGSPNMSYFEYPETGGKDPIENPDSTFIPLKLDNLKKQAERFVANDIDSSVLGLLPEAKKNELIEKYGIKVVDSRVKATKYPKIDMMHDMAPKRNLAWHQALKIAQSKSK